MYNYCTWVERIVYELNRNYTECYYLCRFAPLSSADAVRAREEIQRTGTHGEQYYQRCLVSVWVYFLCRPRNSCVTHNLTAGTVFVSSGWCSGGGDGDDAAGVVAARQLKIQTSNLPPPPTTTHLLPTQHRISRSLTHTLQLVLFTLLTLPATAIVQGILGQIGNGGQQSWRYPTPFQHFDDDEARIIILLIDISRRTEATSP